MSQAKPILIVQTAFLGDLLLSVPLMKRARVLSPHSEIHLVCRRGIGSLFKDLKLVDQVFEIEKGNKSTYQAIQKKLKKYVYQWILCPHQSLTSALFVRTLKADKKIAFKQKWNFLFFDTRIDRDAELPDALRQLSLLQPIDDSVKAELAGYQKEIPKDSHAKTLFNSQLMSPIVSLSWTSKTELPKPYVCLFPGSVWATKQWSEEGFLKVGQSLARKHHIVLMGGEGEKELAQRLASQIPNSTSMAGRSSLQESLAIINQSELVITNDSAGQHLASLVGKPTISIFGPTVLDFGYRPWNNSAVIVESGPMKCRPCGKHGHMKCPIGTHECMKSISANQVLKAAQTFGI